VPHHAEGPLRPAQEQEMGQTAQTAQKEGDNQGKGDVVDCAHEPGTTGNTNEKVADDQEQSPPFSPFALRPEVSPKIRYELVVALLAHVRLTVPDNTRSGPFPTLGGGCSPHVP
jgi:hypothetical protein